MYTWKKLADKFNELAEPLEDDYIDVQWEDSNTHTSFPGFFRTNLDDYQNSFEILSQIAGEKLKDLPRRYRKKHDIESVEDPKKSWFIYLWKKESGDKLPTDNEEGNSSQITKPALKSANLCIGFSKFDQETWWQSWGKKILINVLAGIILIFIGILIEGWLGLTDLFKK